MAGDMDGEAPTMADATAPVVPMVVTPQDTVALGAATTAQGMGKEQKEGVVAAEARPAATPVDRMADAEMADAMALVARAVLELAGLVVGKADGAELEAVLRVEVVEAVARRLGCQVDAQEPAE